MRILSLAAALALSACSTEQPLVPYNDQTCYGAFGFHGPWYCTTGNDTGYFAQQVHAKEQQ